MRGRLVFVAVAVFLVAAGLAPVAAAAEPQWVGDRYDVAGDGVGDDDLREAVGHWATGDASLYEVRLLIAARGGTVGPEARAEYFIHRYVNQERTSRGLSALSWDNRIGDVARQHSDDMADRDFYDHVNPDGQEPADRLAAAGHCNAPSAENIMYSAWTDGFDWRRFYDGPRVLADEFVASWMNSTGHRRNILEDYDGVQWDTAGVGLTIDTDANEIYATQNFAGCSDVSPTVQIQEASSTGGFDVTVQDAGAVRLMSLPADVTVQSATSVQSGVDPTGAGDLTSTQNTVAWVTPTDGTATYTVDFDVGGLATDTQYPVEVVAESTDSDTAVASTTFTVSGEQSPDDDAVDRYDSDGNGIDTTELQTAIQDFLQNNLGTAGLQAVIQSFLSS